MQAPIDGLLFYSERLPWGTSVGTAVREDLYLTPFTDADNWTLYHGDCLDALAELSDSSVNLIATDPPYFRIKNLPWDRQWDKPTEYLAWLDRVAAEWQRVLAPNGSLYCFASPKMSARVECLLGERFNVLNQIVWTKPNTPGFDGWKQKCSKDSLRLWYQQSERIIFAEHINAVQNMFGHYIAAIRKQHGLTMSELTAAARAHGAVNHGGACSNWESGINIPTREHYDALRQAFPGCFNSEYDGLRQKYDDLRRPFSVTADVPYTDVWDFPTVRPYPGKHPCEKPLEMMEHIVRASSREGDTVLDCFMGSGVTGEAAIRNGRKFVGVEMAEEWCKAAEERIMWTPPIGESVV